MSAVKNTQHSRFPSHDFDRFADKNNNECNTSYVRATRDEASLSCVKYSRRALIDDVFHGNFAIEGIPERAELVADGIGVEGFGQRFVRHRDAAHPKQDGAAVRGDLLVRREFVDIQPVFG